MIYTILYLGALVTFLIFWLLEKQAKTQTNQLTELINEVKLDTGGTQTYIIDGVDFCSSAIQQFNLDGSSSVLEIGLTNSINLNGLFTQMYVYSDDVFVGSSTFWGGYVKNKWNRGTYTSLDIDTYYPYIDGGDTYSIEIDFNNNSAYDFDSAPWDNDTIFHIDLSGPSNQSITLEIFSVGC